MRQECALIVLEIALVYFIMPMPGSQGMRSIEAAYFLQRWLLRAVVWMLILATVLPAWRVGGWRKWLVSASLLVAGAVTYMVNFQMSADRIFVQTGTDTLSWRKKSWVLGVTANGRSKAFDWNRLRRQRVVNDEVGNMPIVIVLARDDASFFAFQRPDAESRFALRGESLIAGDQAYDLRGTGASTALTPLNVSQEFWHSRRTFHPATERY